ncbi:MAG TPA: polysaccharide deacetylase [Anaerovoracaceae bacterium]|nr:polysaccharide deacetylase [Anaerovoracaceae bacterium]
MYEKKFPVILSFDIDAETLWTSRDPEHAKRPVQLSMGTYGPVEGVPRITKILDKYGIKASFFIPGMTAERYPEMVKALDAAGHEIGNHSYSHKHPHTFDSKEAEKEELVKSNKILENLTGKVPVGYRSPAWEFSTYSVDIIEEMGFKWGSNMMYTDQVNLMKVFDKQTDIVDIPVAWVLDDAAYWLYSVHTPGKCMQPLDAVETYWKTEFDFLYEEFMDDTDGSRKNACFMLTCHPQIIGRPARMTVLENLIKHIRTRPNAVFMTGYEVAEKFRAENK